MDKRFGRWGMWVALAMVALLFFCVVVGCFGAAAISTLRPAGAWMPPQGGEGGAVPPTVFYPAHGGWGPLGVLGAGMSLFLKLLLVGLLVLLLFRLVRRLFWGRWHTCSPYGYGPWKGVPQGVPGGEAEDPDAGTAWGPPPWKRHAWRHHHRAWGPPPWWGSPPEEGGPAPETESGEPVPDPPDSEYSGPME